MQVPFSTIYSNGRVSSSEDSINHTHQLSLIIRDDLIHKEIVKMAGMGITDLGNCHLFEMEGIKTLNYLLARIEQENQ